MPHMVPQDQAQTKAEPPESLHKLVHQAGIKINGPASTDMQVYSPEVYSRLLRRGSLGLGEAYMEDLWEAEDLAGFFTQVLQHDLNAQVRSWKQLPLWGLYLKQLLLNPQSRSRAFQVGQQHYDTDKSIFTTMLDKSLTYSCGYWRHAKNLNQAQEHKMDLICRKLQLQPGEKLLDIGCGWGSMARHAAQNYGVEVLGITVSQEQQQEARQRNEGLPVRFELQDYRDLQRQFDKVVSIGMFEHVGPKNHRTFFRKVHELLKPEGLFLLHTIGSHVTNNRMDPWIEKYIFPNGKIPSAPEIASASEELFILEDWHNFGLDYDRTLSAWWENFKAAWPQLEQNYSRQFLRMWKYYLQSCAGFFRSRQGQLWQLVFSHRQRPATYRGIRCWQCDKPAAS